ncbi:MAG: MFS transporter, partial [Pseudomonadota bacterium]
AASFFVKVDGAERLVNFFGGKGGSGHVELRSLLRRKQIVLRGQRERARDVLARLFGPAIAEAKVTEIDGTLAKDHAPRLADLKDPQTGRLRRLVWVGIGLAAFQQLVGINVVFYYGAVLWQSVGFTESDALLINIVSGSVSILACLLTIALIDRIGRKPLLFGGSIGMALSLAGVMVAFALASVDETGSLSLSPALGRVALICANLYVFVFNMSWGPVMWVMLGEMFPNQLRGSGLAVSGFVQWGANFAITMTFPIMLASIGLAGAYGFYFVCALLSAVFVWRLVHETRGRELEAMAG